METLKRNLEEGEGFPEGGLGKGHPGRGATRAKAKREEHCTFSSESEGDMCPSIYCMTSTKPHHVPEPQFPHQMVQSHLLPRITSAEQGMGT